MVPLRGWRLWLLNLVLYGLFTLLLALALAGQLRAPFGGETVLGVTLPVSSASLLSLGILVAWLVLVLSLGWRAVVHARWRARTLSGERDAMPLARLRVPPLSRDQVPSGEVTYTWRRKSGGWSNSGKGRALIALGCWSFAFLVALVAIARRESPDAMNEFLLLALMFVFCAAIPHIRPLYAPATIEVSADGLRQLGSKGAGPLIHWAEVRLLEVTRNAQGNPPDAQATFIVYGNAHGKPARVSWHYPPGPRRNPPDEALSTLPELLATVTARTGLTFRTCHPFLRAGDPSPVRRLTLAQVLAVVSFCLVLPWVSAGAVIIAPLTPYVALNTYVAGCLALLSLGYLGFLRWRSQMAPGPHTAALPPLPTLEHDPEAAGENGPLYDCTWTFTRGERARWFAAGLIYLAASAATLYACVTEERGRGLVIVLLIILGTIAISGLAAPFVRRRSIFADNYGVSGQQTVIPWFWLTDLWRVGAAETGRYYVRGFLGEEVAWRAQPLAADEPRWDPEALTGAELAAVVAARTGLPLQDKSR